MKYFVLAILILLCIVNIGHALWTHEPTLAWAWGSALLGWVSSLFANLANDQ